MSHSLATKQWDRSSGRQQSVSVISARVLWQVAEIYLRLVSSSDRLWAGWLRRLRRCMTSPALPASRRGCPCSAASCLSVCLSVCPSRHCSQLVPRLLCNNFCRLWLVGSCQGCVSAVWMSLLACWAPSSTRPGRVSHQLYFTAAALSLSTG